MTSSSSKGQVDTRVLTWPKNKDFLEAATVPVTEFNTPELANNIILMLAAMKVHDAVGIASNQIGIHNSIVILQPSDLEFPLIMINPEIVDDIPEEDIEEGSEEVDEPIPFLEGYLCIPEYYRENHRKSAVNVSFANQKGEVKTLRLEGFYSVLIQHEIEMLGGIQADMEDIIGADGMAEVIERNEGLIESQPTLYS